MLLSIISLPSTVTEVIVFLIENGGGGGESYGFLFLIPNRPSQVSSLSSVAVEVEKDGLPGLILGNLPRTGRGVTEDTEDTEYTGRGVTEGARIPGGG